MPDVYPGGNTTLFGLKLMILFLSSDEINTLKSDEEAYVSVIGTTIGYPMHSVLKSAIFIKGESA